MLRQLTVMASTRSGGGEGVPRLAFKDKDKKCPRVLVIPKVGVNYSRMDILCIRPTLYKDRSNPSFHFLKACLGQFPVPTWCVL